MASVVLVHGVRTSASMWRTQCAALDDAGIPNIAVDLPGHGASVGEPFTLESARDVIDTAVDAMPGPHVVVGLSLGSYVTVDWAARTTRQPAALLLASCGTRPRGLALAAYQAIADMVERLPDGGLRLHTAMTRRVLGGSAEDVLAGGVAVGVTGPVLRQVGRLDMEAALGEVSCPIWFVNGARDHFRAEERLILSAARAATLVIIPRAGHLVPIDQPGAFARLVADAVSHAAASSP